MNSRVVESSCVTGSSTISHECWQSLASALIGWRSISLVLSSGNNPIRLDQRWSLFCLILLASMLITRPPTLRGYSANFGRRLKRPPLPTAADLAMLSAPMSPSCLKNIGYISSSCIDDDDLLPFVLRQTLSRFIVASFEQRVAQV